MPKVLIIMGSKNDFPVAEKAVEIFKKFDIESEVVVASAHRTPKRVEDLARGTDAEVLIAIAGLSAALPGAVAAATVKPVIGVPVSGKINLDALLSVVQMPPGIPVAAVGLDRGENAALLAVQILSVSDSDLRNRLWKYREDMTAKVIKDSEEVHLNV
ncbi:MAG: 5-(carboxyamino)imidazole ribonucleotide mutase [Candidatus Methanomethylophilaceae archaeon]